MYLREFTGSYSARQSRPAAPPSDPRSRRSRFSFLTQPVPLHPIHLKGMLIRLLARNGEEIHEPFFGDALLIRGHDALDIGVVPLDEGEWMMHCHISSTPRRA